MLTDISNFETEMIVLKLINTFRCKFLFKTFESDYSIKTKQF